MAYKDESNPKRKKKWVVHIRKPGAPPKTRFGTKKEAEQWEQKTLRELEEASHSLHGVTGTVSFRMWADEYLTYLESKSVKHYKAGLLAFKRLAEWQDNSVIVTRGKVKRDDGGITVFWAGDPVTVFTPKLFTKFLAYVGANFAAGGANNARTMLMTAWNWGVRILGMPWQNPLVWTDEQNEDERDSYIPTAVEFQTLYEYITDRQDRVMLLTYFLTSARRSELFSLRWQDVDFANDRIRLYSRKNRKGQRIGKWIKMPKVLQEAMMEQRQRTEQYDYVFIHNHRGWNGPFKDRGNWLRTVTVKAGLPRFSYHGVRHLTASLMSFKGIPVKEIQQHLRHAHLSTTDRYIHDLKERVDGKVDANRALAEIFLGDFVPDFAPLPEAAAKLAPSRPVLQAVEGRKKSGDSGKIVSLFGT